MNSCPCCSGRLLRQIRGSELHWFCPSCWQEMPLLDQSPNAIVHSSLSLSQLISVPDSRLLQSQS